MSTGQEGTEVDTSNPGKGADAGADKSATQNDGEAKGSASNGSLLEQLGDKVDAETKGWFEKQQERLKDLPSLVKFAREQDKFVGEQKQKLGDAIRIPGENATADEIKAFREKMDIPLAPDGYQFKAPEKLPDGLPYDGERAKAFAAKAAELGLSKKQAAGLHDWVTENAVSDFNTSKQADDERRLATAKDETAKLVKVWGPLTGETFKANAAFADKVLTEMPGGKEALESLQRAKLIGNEGGVKVIQDAAIAQLLANIGRSFYKEDDVIRGDPSKLDNPFADGKENVTAQMKLIRQDRQLALSYIQAAGKKPSDFGLTN